jgi:hypothetical protein
MNCSKEKVKVVPFGANLESEKSYSEIENIIEIGIKIFVSFFL